MVLVLLGCSVVWAEEMPNVNPAAVARPRNDWIEAHDRLVKRAKEGNIDLLFLGDSITAGWGSPNGGAAIWKERYEPLKAVNFGIGGDRTEHVLWRIRNGELDGYQPKVVVLLIGTNNRSQQHSASQIAGGIEAIVREIREKSPATKILVMGVFPTDWKAESPARALLAEVNQAVAKLDDGKNVFFLDIGTGFLEPDGKILPATMPDALHLTSAGYKIWADGMQAKLNELMASH